MFRKRRSRPTGSSKQSGSSIVPDETIFSSHFHEQVTKPATSHFINSPKIFKGFLKNQIFEADEPISMMGSAPETKHTFSLDKTIPTTKNRFWDQNESRGIGLALIDSMIVDDHADDSESASPASKQGRKLVLFGSQLKINVPSPHFPSNYSPGSPAEFGIKTPRSNLCGIGFADSSSGSMGEAISIEEMEMSEDYTCVITHGPNPKTTRIFGNCVVDSSCGEIRAFAATRKEEMFSWSGNSRSSSSSSSSDDFLRFCHRCNAELGHGKDIYMYRGEKAFCSQECRCQEMLFDAVEN